jgi:proliferating cell nuclear antigen PCNA
MTVIFKAKTSDAYHMKILAELLTNNIKTAHFEIDSEGIRLCMMDHHRRILINLELLAENFTLYKFKTKKMYIGINLNHFHKMLKSIKKKDSLQLYIDDTTPNDLAIRVIPKENNRVTTSYVQIQVVQEIDIDLPTGYGKPVIVSASEFQKMIKDFGNIANTIQVISKNFHIQFKCDAGGILKRNVEFGEMEDSDEETEPERHEEYNRTFATEQLSRITKMSGLSSQMKIFPGNPLLFRSNVGSLGEVSVYVKSKEQIEQENLTVDEDEFSD